MTYSVSFSGRAHYYTESEIAVAIDAMRSAVPLTQGEFLQSFEHRFREFARVEHAFAVSNATAALELIAQLCQFGSGDEVVIPSHTFTSSAYPFVKAGAKIVWADIDMTTRVVTAKTIAKCITPKTRAVVVPHLYGYGAEMPAIMTLAESFGLLVIEDVAQALGVMIDGRMAGSFGDFSAYSFHSHKNISTLGEGGMLVLKDPDIASVVPMLRHNGHCPYAHPQQDYWVPAMGNVDLPELNGKLLWPANYCLGEVECALGSKLLERIEKINLEKRQRALGFIDALDDCPELVFHRETSTRHNYHLLVAQVKNKLRDKFIRQMASQHGIQCVVQYYPLNRYPFYQKLDMGEANCPNADTFFDNMVSFPFHHSLKNSEIDHIISASQETLKQLRNP